MVLNTAELLDPITIPLMKPLEGVKWAKKNNENNNFLFIQYQELVETPQKVIEKIYEFCGWEPFEHSFERIKVKYPINDEYYGIPGLHDIREKVEFLENDIELSQEVLDKIALLESE
jgi:sulfotransferase